MIYTFGDSHAFSSFHDIPGLSKHGMGAIKMESVGKVRKGEYSASKLLDDILAENGVQKSELVIFCFGEIDVRCGIQPRIDSGEDEDSVINEIVLNCVAAIRNSEFKNLGILSITPAVSIIGHHNNAAFPFLGTDEARSRYTRKMNGLLRSECPKAGIHFLDVYDQYRDDDGMLIHSLSDHQVHIGDTRYVKIALEKLIKLVNAE